MYDVNLLNASTVYTLHFHRIPYESGDISDSYQRLNRHKYRINAFSCLWKFHLHTMISFPNRNNQIHWYVRGTSVIIGYNIVHAILCCIVFYISFILRKYNVNFIPFNVSILYFIIVSWRTNLRRSVCKYFKKSVLWMI